MHDLAVSESTTYLDIQAHFVADLSGNLAAAVMDTNVDVYRNDITSPKVIDFSLNMNGNIIIRLDEIVDGQTFRPEYIIIQGIDNSTGHEDEVYVLRSSTVMPVDTRRLEITLSDEDLNGIKANQRIATSHRTTYLAINGSAILDIIGNPIESRLTVVSREVKKKQHARTFSGLRDRYSELFTWMAALKF